MLSLLVAVSLTAVPAPLNDVTYEALEPTVRTLAQQVIDDDPDLRLYINSPGGSVRAMLAFIDYVTQLKAQSKKQMLCLVNGQAASAAAVIFEAVCDVRIMTKGSTLLFHRPYIRMTGNADELEEASKALREIDAILVDLCIPRLSITREEFWAHIASEDWVLTEEQALDVGAADLVI